MALCLSLCDLLGQVELGHPSSTPPQKAGDLPAADPQKKAHFIDYFFLHSSWMSWMHPFGLPDGCYQATSVLCTNCFLCLESPFLHSLPGRFLYQIFRLQFGRSLLWLTWVLILYLPKPSWHFGIGSSSVQSHPLFSLLLCSPATLSQLRCTMSTRRCSMTVQIKIKSLFWISKVVVLILIILIEIPRPWHWWACWHFWGWV